MSKKDLYIAEMRRLLDHWDAHVCRRETGEQEIVHESQRDNDAPEDLGPQRSRSSLTKTASAMSS